ncbi:PaaI family thioesterase [Coprobacter tertius]|uniref:PaaI family thioesterase n=1 Tax=Coprobacter tertius TaxID=2944915 RepID=A0ABT1MCW1_9BACT|nr:PaaI family thioesterase [Coprobacter tertius]MCP9610482.1 PaaI family thioesterase [Coprobacter tertius]
MNYIDFFKNDRFATDAGIRLLIADPGYAKAVLIIEDQHLNAGNVVQGGALFTLADLAMAAAANAHGRLAFSIQSDIRFLASAKKGDTLTAEAREILLHKTLCHYKVEITDQEGKLIAVCDGICYRK